MNKQVLRILEIYIPYIQNYIYKQSAKLRTVKEKGVQGKMEKSTVGEQVEH